MFPAGAFENEKQKVNKNMGQKYIFRKCVCKQIFSYGNGLKTSRDAMVNSL